MLRLDCAGPCRDSLRVRGIGKITQPVSDGVLVVVWITPFSGARISVLP